MIDIENKIFDTVSTMLRNTYPDIYVSGQYIDAPPSFPCVTLVEDDNSTSIGFVDMSRNETYADVLYTVNVYSNLANGKKSQAKEIIEAIDEQMLTFGFTRAMMNQLPNLDRTIYRVTARYNGRIHKMDNDKYVIHSR